LHQGNQNADFELELQRLKNLEVKNNPKLKHENLFIPDKRIGAGTIVFAVVIIILIGTLFI